MFVFSVNFISLLFFVQLVLHVHCTCISQTQSSGTIVVVIVRMVVGFTTTYAISAYHHYNVVSSNPTTVGDKVCQ
jgi:hypothetical protein